MSQSQLPVFKMPFEYLDWGVLYSGLKLNNKGGKREDYIPVIFKRIKQAFERELPFLPPRIHRRLENCLDSIRISIKRGQFDEAKGLIAGFKDALHIAGEMAFLDEDHRRGGALEQERRRKHRERREEILSGK
jgi:hypothetical protein